MCKRFPPITQHTVHRAYRAGSTMTEYGLIGFLVAGGLTVVLLNLGSAISNQALSMLGSSYAGKSAATIKTTDIKTSNHPTVTPGIKGSVQIKLSNGTWLELTNYPQNLTTSVNTAGANGTTTMLADSIQVIGAQAFAAGTITEAQYNSLVALANQAHRIARVEQALENAASSATSSEAFSNTSIMFDGKTYSPSELRQLIGYGNGSNSPNAVANHLTDPTAYPETAAFQALYSQALQSGALNEPSMLNTVQSLSDQVAFLSDVTTISTINILTNTIMPDTLTQDMASLVTHSNAIDICATGNGTDIGVVCSTSGSIP